MAEHVFIAAIKNTDFYKKLVDTTANPREIKISGGSMDAFAITLPTEKAAENVLDFLHKNTSRDRENYMLSQCEEEPHTYRRLTISSRFTAKKDGLSLKGESIIALLERLPAESEEIQKIAGEKNPASAAEATANPAAEVTPPREPTGNTPPADDGRKPGHSRRGGQSGPGRNRV